MRNYKGLDMVLRYENFEFIFFFSLVWENGWYLFMIDVGEVSF